MANMQTADQPRTPALELPRRQICTGAVGDTLESEARAGLPIAIRQPSCTFVQ